MHFPSAEGAQAIGLGDQIGSLESGKQADRILVNLGTLNLSPVLETPVRNIVPNLVYVASGHDVQTVMVARRVLLRDRQVPTVDAEAVRARAQAQAGAQARRVAAKPVHRGRPVLTVSFPSQREGWGVGENGGDV